MKKYVEVLKDSFTDYAGRVHHFVIVGMSNPLNDTVAIYRDNSGIKSLGGLEKGVSLGISICNPEDKFDEKVGVLKATYRAENSPISLYAHDGGQINSPLVRAFIAQEAEYLKHNPEVYIKGYAEAKARWEKNTEMKNIKEKFTPTEKIVAEELQNNPKFLDNVQKYVDWALNQNKGKCKKHTK